MGKALHDKRTRNKGTRKKNKPQGGGPGPFLKSKRHAKKVATGTVGKKTHKRGREQTKDECRETEVRKGPAKPTRRKGGSQVPFTRKAKLK